MQAHFNNMDCAPNVNIFRELQVVHDTGYFSSQISPEEDWQQVKRLTDRLTGDSAVGCCLISFGLCTQLVPC